jgi:hypothetical protein
LNKYIPNSSGFFCEKSESGKIEIEKIKNVFNIGVFFKISANVPGLGAVLAVRVTSPRLGCKLKNEIYIFKNNNS